MRALSLGSLLTFTVERPGGCCWPAPGLERYLHALSRFSGVYALAIGHFADRLRAAARWCRNGRARSACCRARSVSNCRNCWCSEDFIRASLMAILAAKTREALRSFQASIGAPADGFASAGVLDRLRQR